MLNWALILMCSVSTGPCRQARMPVTGPVQDTGSLLATALFQPSQVEELASMSVEEQLDYFISRNIYLETLLEEIKKKI